MPRQILRIGEVSGVEQPPGSSWGLDQQEQSDFGARALEVGDADVVGAGVELDFAARACRGVDRVVAYDQFFVHVDFCAVVGEEVKFVLSGAIDAEDSPVVHAKPLGAVGHAGNAEGEETGVDAERSGVDGGHGVELGEAGKVDGPGRQLIDVAAEREGRVADSRAEAIVCFALGNVFCEVIREEGASRISAEPSAPVLRSRTTRRAERV